MYISVKTAGKWKIEISQVYVLNRLIDYGYEPRESYVENVKQYMDTGEIPFNVPLLELKLTNLCNSQSAECVTQDPSLWWQDWAKVEKYYDEDTQNYIQKTLKL